MITKPAFQLWWSKIKFNIKLHGGRSFILFVPGTLLGAFEDQSKYLWNEKHTTAINSPQISVTYLSKILFPVYKFSIGYQVLSFIWGVRSFSFCHHVTQEFRLLPACGVLAKIPVCEKWWIVGACWWFQPLLLLSTRQQ